MSDTTETVPLPAPGATPAGLHTGRTAAEEAAETEAVRGAADDFNPSPGGRIARVAVAFGLVGLVVGLPAWLDLAFAQDYVSLAAIYACVALSMNVLTGYLGQLSLGHQAFFGIGAFVAANLVTNLGLPFPAGILAAGLSGAVSCLVLGAVALRVQGLYLAIVTLAYGLLAQGSLFGIRSLTGGGAGVAALRTGLIGNPRNFAWVCLSVLALLYLFDLRLMATKAGRAMLAIRDDERVAASFGIDITRFKLLAFVISGTYAGLAGGLFGFWLQQVVATPFDLTLALTFVIMTVVGGLGSRIGVVIGGAFFATVDPIIELFYGKVVRPLFELFGTELGETVNPTYAPVIGAALLLLTLIQFKGGIAQQVQPIRGWLLGGRFDLHASKDSSAFEQGGGGVGRP